MSSFTTDSSLLYTLIQSNGGSLSLLFGSPYDKALVFRFWSMIHLDRDVPTQKLHWCSEEGECSFGDVICESDDIASDWESGCVSCNDGLGLGGLWSKWEGSEKSACGRGDTQKFPLERGLITSTSIESVSCEDIPTSSSTTVIWSQEAEEAPSSSSTPLSGSWHIDNCSVYWLWKCQFVFLHHLT